MSAVDASTRDPGLQPERTRLASMRTGLSLAVSLLLLARLSTDALGPAVWLAALVGLGVIGWTVLPSDRAGRLVGPRTAAYTGSIVLLAVIESAAILRG